MKKVLSENKLVSRAAVKKYLIVQTGSNRQVWCEAVPDADPDDARELLNYRSAFEFVSECLDSGDPVTEGLIREIHRKLVEGLARLPGRTEDFAGGSATATQPSQVLDPAWHCRVAG